MYDEQQQRALRVLGALYEMARADIHATPEAVAEWLGMPDDRVGDLLERLDAQGLIDREPCRLTMTGLVLAVSWEGSQKIARHAA